MNSVMNKHGFAGIGGEVPVRAMPSQPSRNPVLVARRKEQEAEREFQDFVKALSSERGPLAPR